MLQPSISTDTDVNNANENTLGKLYSDTILHYVVGKNNVKVNNSE